MLVLINEAQFFSSTDRRGDISCAATTTSVLPIVTATSNAAVSAAKSWQSDAAATGVVRPAATTVPCDAATSATHQAAATASGATGSKARTARASHGLWRSSSESWPIVGHQELRHTATTGKYQILLIF